MNSMSVENPLDLRDLAPRERHPLVFSTFRRLASSQALELVNDHDPSPLREQLAVLWPGRFSWDVLENGPLSWSVRITKLATAPGQSGCCGSCGGA
ncbi:DUF2249 domain-containing protein [Roseateles cellulosilyticus]|uniref:DUF2249 domain-containing protein n=1 Tax=Pelomonas cellulosilytica TaxID=2906762 RepID=A0ABS8XSF2_9BURK|nr:DUF2249 domain-containing protein [Pelomonas sp. P8]MCE4554660.1 DUF2249 domain-containing protein [Pelomonas sp. P8]